VSIQQVPFFVEQKFNRKSGNKKTSLGNRNSMATHCRQTIDSRPSGY